VKALSREMYVSTVSCSVDDLNVRFETTHSENAYALIAVGGGIAILDPRCMGAWADHVKIRPFGAEVPADVYIIRSRQEEPSVAGVRQCPSRQCVVDVGAPAK
jgi:DNA-binding transcriptional LysR family regulator